MKESLFAALVTDGQTYILNHLELRQREKLTNMKGMKYCIFYTKYILYNKLYIHYQNNLLDYMMQFKVIFLKRLSLTYIHTSDWQQTKPYLDHLEKYDAFGGIHLRVSIER